MTNETKPTAVHRSVRIPRDLDTFVLYVQVSDHRESYNAALNSVIRKAKEESEQETNNPTN